MKRKKCVLKEEEILALLRLQKTSSIGDILAKKLIATVGNAADIFTENKNTLLKINGIGEYAVRNLLNNTQQKLAEKELQYINTHKIKYSYFLDDDYPKNLHNCIDAPILFFKTGSIDFSNKRIISVVGTRTMTNYGKSFCEKLIDELSPYNPIIVSGFAYGIDICAHTNAFKQNLQTIAILAHGLNHMYPKAHRKYSKQVNQHGGFITEFFHDETPLRENFLKRNRIVAGISDATIVVESASKGGSLVTADIANSYDRDVFAVPGRINDVMSKGCNDLIYRNKAHLLKSSMDLVKMLNWDISPISLPKQIKLFEELPKEHQKVVDYLQKQQQVIDVIALDLEMSVSNLATILLQLELKGIVKPIQGKIFKLS